MAKLLQHDSQLSGGCRLVETAWGGGMPPSRWPNDGYGQQNCQVLKAHCYLYNHNQVIIEKRGGTYSIFFLVALSDWPYVPVKIDPVLIG